MKTYSAPALLDLGTVHAVTAADQQPNQTDQIFNQGQVVGSNVGSLDACITPNRNPPPGSNCR